MTHGPHQVAQKSTITTFPLISLRDNDFPEMSSSMKFGAGPASTFPSSTVLHALMSTRQKKTTIKSRILLFFTI
jgi:hypothetical protein